MPHLAPLKWFFLTLLFWFLLLICFTATWWSMAPKITPFASSFSPIIPIKWPWM